MDFRSILDAALDVAAERLTAQHPDRQVFIFGPEGKPFWAKDPVLPGELEWLSRAVGVIEAEQNQRSRPFVVSPVGLPFTVLALDEAGELYAVVLSNARALPAEVRTQAERTGQRLPEPVWLRITKPSGE